MKDILIQLLTALVGSLGFSLVFGLRRRYLPAAALGGLLSWGLFLLLEALSLPGFLSALLASAFAVVYAELLAKGFRSPATLFLVPAIIPLVPGSSLYYAMSCAVRGDLGAARSYSSLTLEYALAIAAGISFVIAARELRSPRR